MTLRPTNFPDWATDNPNGIVQPSSADQAVGWSANQSPAAEVANYLQSTTAQWLRYLDKQSSGTILASSLDFSTRLIGGGLFSYNGTTLSWSSPFYVAIPSSADVQNTVVAGSVNIPAGSLAYVTANMPFSTTATTTAGSAILTSVLYGDQAIAGQMATGPGIPDNTAVSAVSDDGQSITLSKSCTASASGVAVTFSSSGTLTPAVAVSASFVPGPNTVVFARASNASCFVGIGSGQMKVADKEAKFLLEQGYIQVVRFIAGEALPAGTPVYLSSASDGRTAGSVYKCDASAANGAKRAQILGFVVTDTASGSEAKVVSAGLINGLSGLTPGQIYYIDPATPGALTATRPTTAGLYAMPVGFAITGTCLRTNPSATANLVALSDNLTVTGFVSANSVRSASGFKTVVDMHGAAMGGSLPPNTVWNSGTYRTIFTPEDRAVITAPFSLTCKEGSLVGLSANFFSTGDNATYSVTINKNGTALVTQTLNMTGAGTISPTFAKGLYAIASGDKLTASVSVTNRGSVGNNMVQIRADVSVFVELSA